MFMHAKVNCHEYTQTCLHSNISVLSRFFVFTLNDLKQKMKMNIIAALTL